MLAKLKQNVGRQMKELIELTVEKTIELIEKWYEDSYSEQLILEELSEFPEIQFNFLMKYLHFNELSIKIVINESNYQKEKKEQAEKYTQYLELFVELLCKLNLEGKLNITDEIIEAYVKKDYYPIPNCMDICKRYS